MLVTALHQSLLPSTQGPASEGWEIKWLCGHLKYKLGTQIRDNCLWKRHGISPYGLRTSSQLTQRPLWLSSQLLNIYEILYIWQCPRVRDRWMKYSLVARDYWSTLYNFPFFLITMRCVCVCACNSACGGQKTALWSQVSLSTFSWVPAIKLGQSGLSGSVPYPLSHLAGPVYNFLMTTACLYLLKTLQTGSQTPGPPFNY